jgi:hypothetical protein
MFVNKFSFIVIILWILLIGCAVAFAASPGVQLSKPVSCRSSTEVFGMLHGKELGETVVWAAVNSDLGGDDAPSIALTVNPEAKTWTLVEFDATQACILGIGRGYIAPGASILKGVRL